MFAGIMVAGAVVANPGLVDSFGGGSIASAAGNVLHIGDREGDEDEYGEDDEDAHENEDDRGQAAQFESQGNVDMGAPVSQKGGDGRGREDREHRREPSSIFVNQAGDAPPHEHDEDDDQATGNRQ